MNRTLRSVFLSAVALAALLCLGCIVTHSAHAGVPMLAQLSPPAAPLDEPVIIPSADATSVVIGFLASHAWLSSVLAAFGALSVGYQAVIAWAHQRAAATADDADDKWLASLEARPWFKILDRLFYWGGYLGSALGGKKL